MGEHSVNQVTNREQQRAFSKHLFRDIQALEILLERDEIESGITRIGAEQELCIIDGSFRPVPMALPALDLINDDHFTTELSQFNLEINLDPQEFKSAALSKMELQLKSLLTKLGKTLAELKSDYVLVGILPTIRRSDLVLENMTPNPRYYALNETILRMRGGMQDFSIQGVDELITKADTVMFESCNTSFQVHYQLSAKDFVSKYNWAQAITGPVLSIATNSPLLMTRRLWRETRIALFQQSTDTRRNSELMREQHARVHFGSHWLRDSVMDVFKEDVARFRPLISQDIDEDSLEAIREGRAPQLRALRLHNGSIYKWNRACYGISDNGKPHLRIENRIFPSGPSVVDEMANTAFWLGLMHGMPKSYARLHKTADFDHVKTNFHRAARMGMGAMFRWVNDKVYSAQELALKELLPIAEEGLKHAQIQQKDIDRYLGIIRERVETGRSGSQWMLDSFIKLKKKGTKEEAAVALTAGMARRQKRGMPVHKWSLARIDEAGSWINRYWRIDQIMQRNIVTIDADDPVDVAPNIMTWQNIRHLPVENDEGDFVGLLTSGTLINHYPKQLDPDAETVLVRDVMIRDLITVKEDTLTVEAISLMRKHKIGCLPVVNDEYRLVGIVTERDFVNIADHFLQEFMGQKNEAEEKEKK